MFLRASGERRLRRRLFSRRVRQAAPRCLRDRSLFCLGACCRGRENRARASLPCGTSNTCVMRLAGRGGTRGAAVFTPGEGKHAFAVIFLLCVGCSHAGRGKTGRLAEVRRFFWRKIGADVGRKGGFGGRADSGGRMGGFGKAAPVCSSVHLRQQGRQCRR